MARSFQSSTTGKEKVEDAFNRKGKTQEYLAGSVGCSRPIVSQFLAGRKIDKAIFQSLCGELGLKWEDIVDWDIEEAVNKVSSGETCNAMTPTTPADVTEDQTETDPRVAYAIAGTVAKVDLPKIKAIIALLQRKTGDFSIEIVDIEEGSVRLILEGSQLGLEQIETLFKSGQLTEVLGIPVLDAQFLTTNNSEQEQDIKVVDKQRLVFTIDASISPEDLQAVKALLNPASDNTEEIKTDHKSRRAQEIRSQGARRRDLRGANLISADLRGANLSNASLSDANLSNASLSDANLIGANLIGANLSGAYLRGAYMRDANLISANLNGADLNGADLNGANLISADLSGAELNGADLRGAFLSGADLSNANLSGADLSGADLSGAKLSRAKLSRADLSDADLSDADLSGAKVEKAQFQLNSGITEAMKQDLIQRGAIFNDSPGDRSNSLVPIGNR